MRRTTIYLPEELHADLERLAWTIGSTMTDLLRHAARKTFANDFEVARQERPPFSGIPKELGALNSAVHKEKLARDRRFRHNRGP